MFLANIFYYSKVIFKVKKRNTRLFHSRIFLYEIYYMYCKINGSVTIFKFCHSVNKTIVHFKNSEINFLAGMPTSKCCSYYTLLAFQFS